MTIRVEYYFTDGKYPISSYHYVEFKSFDEIYNYNNISFLDCSNNQLTKLPKLPDKLIYLFCEYNQLTSLPELPNSLQYLWCSNNQLISLPKLPDSLKTISCEYNQLIEFPNLPKNLENLLFSNEYVIKKNYKYLYKLL
jgi:Leucine-rich repeat (LRR) protein